jgi:hypothetical protein
MRTLFGALGLVLALSSVAFAKAKTAPSPKPSVGPSVKTFSPAGMVGRWSGYYLQPGPSGPMKVSFMLNLRVKGNEIEGETTESNSFSNDPDRIPNLRSTIKGTLQDRRISFVKTYDIDMHQVEYEGDVELDGLHMAGGYKVGGMEGPFMADLVAPTKSP